MIVVTVFFGAVALIFGGFPEYVSHRRPPPPWPLWLSITPILFLGVVALARPSRVAVSLLSIVAFPLTVLYEKLWPSGHISVLHDAATTAVVNFAVAAAQCSSLCVLLVLHHVSLAASFKPSLKRAIGAFVMGEIILASVGFIPPEATTVGSPITAGIVVVAGLLATYKSSGSETLRLRITIAAGCVLALGLAVCLFVGSPISPAFALYTALLLYACGAYFVMHAAA